MAICSCLSGRVVLRHPSLNILCRDDGAVLLPSKGPHRRRGEWTFGTKRGDGYMCVGFNKKLIMVHVLIAEAFLGKRDAGETVDHIDRNRANNDVKNLRWASWKLQCDNRITVLNAPNYGVRKCDDKNGYCRARYANDPEYREKCKERSRTFYHSRRNKNGN